MTFKEQIARDNRTVFMNMEEFCDMHNINGRDIPCMIDNNEMIDREKRYQYKRSLYGDGVYLKEMLIFVNARDFGPLPPTGKTLMFDKKVYTISDAINENGIYSITLEANKT